MSSLKYPQVGYKSCKTGNAGFSLIEILVGMVMGLISMVIVMQVFATFEGQKRTTSSGSDAQTNAGVGLFTVERDIRSAGYGFADAIGCVVNTAQPPSPSINGTPGNSFVLAPVTITHTSTIGVPDTISIMTSGNPVDSPAGNLGWSLPVRQIVAYAAGANSFTTSSTTGINVNDMLIAYETNAATPPALIKPCSLVQASAVAPPGTPLDIDFTNGNWNSALPATSYSTNGLLIDAGSLLVNYYSVDANNNLIVQQYNTATNSLGAAQIVASDVINLQAQYGFDTRTSAVIATVCPLGSGSGQCTIVDTWSSAMIDANRDGTIGINGVSNGDAARIYAVRFAIAVRSGQKEKPDMQTGVCNTTKVNPTWANGTLTINVDRKPNGTSNPDWMCYRYKIFETVVPLRNPIWQRQ
jgi:type IV pilus assembly protein PilW